MDARIEIDQLIFIKEDEELSLTIPPHILQSLQSLVSAAKTSKTLLKEVALREASPEEAENLKSFYPFWQPGKTYKPGDRFKYNTGEKILIYEVIPFAESEDKSHVAKAEFPPDKTNYLYSDLSGKIVADEEGNPTEEIPDWVQPVWNNPYEMGAKVKHKGSIWEVSQLNTTANPEKNVPAGNSYEPGVWGWTKIG